MMCNEIELSSVRMPSLCMDSLMTVNDDGR